VVLEKYEIHSEDLIYFGDNAIRDIQASQKEGILAVLYDEEQESQLVDFQALRINSWEALKDLLGQE
jgi:putative hydrolase of the HAD superfamily